MKEIRYLMSLESPEKRMVAGMLFIIVFLASGWGVTVYKYSNYRDKKEDQISKMERLHSIEVISFYNRIIEGQTKRQDRLDSALSQVKTIIEKTKK
jgi:hypothetical protein